MAPLLSRIPIWFFRGMPTDHVIVYRNGKPVASGLGASFWVFPWNTVVRIPQAEQTVAFVFRELSMDLQEMTVNGEVRVKMDVDAMSARRDFSVDPATGAYLSDELRKVEGEVRNALSGFFRREVTARDLRDLLTAADHVREGVWTSVADGVEIFGSLGVTVVGIVVTGITPTNATLRQAFEAETREKLLAAADRAVHERRMASADADRKLKERELETQRVLEEGRAKLVEFANANLLSEATAQAEAAKMKLEPYRNADPKVLFALAITEAAKGGIQNLTITPELLSALTRLDGK